MGANQFKASKRKPYEVVIKGQRDQDDYDKPPLLQSLQRKKREKCHLVETAGMISMAKISLGGVPVHWWDFGDMQRQPTVGRSPVRIMYKLLFGRMDGVVYVIDSTDLEKLENVLSEIERDLFGRWFDDNGEEVIMILADGQGEDGAIPLEKIQEKVQELASRQSAETLEKRCLFAAGWNRHSYKGGLEEGLALLLDQIQRREEGKMCLGFTPLTAIHEARSKEKEEIKVHFLKKVVNILSH